MGGTSVFGGTGSILGSFVASYIVGAINAGIVSAGINAFYTQLCFGLVIIISVVLQTIIDRKVRKQSMIVIEYEIERRNCDCNGGGQGIGESISRRFALEGAKVVIADINPDTGVNVAKSINESGGNAISITTDVSDSKAVDKMVSETLDHFGKPTVLINNAGIAVFGPPLEITEEDWKNVFQWILMQFGIVRGLSYLTCLIALKEVL